MTLFQRLGRWFSKKSSRKCYKSIRELPIQIWFNVILKNDMRPLIIKGKYSIDELDDIWTDLNQQYIDEFGMDETFSNQMRLKKELMLLELDLIITEDNFIKNYINIIKAELAGIGVIENSKFEDVLVRLEKIYHVVIDPMNTSVMKYYSYIKNTK